MKFNFRSTRKLQQFPLVLVGAFSLFASSSALAWVCIGLTAIEKIQATLSASQVRRGRKQIVPERPLCGCINFTEAGPVFD